MPRLHQVLLLCVEPNLAGIDGMEGMDGMDGM